MVKYFTEPKNITRILYSVNPIYKDAGSGIAPCINHKVSPNIDFVA